MTDDAIDPSAPSMKVIFLGNSGVGKTSLIARQVEQRFESHLRSTVAATTFNLPGKLPNGSDVLLVLWDTAGQERYRAITLPTYRNAHVAMICFDPREDAGACVDAVAEWSGLVHAHAGPECKLLVVATKADLLAAPAKSACFDLLARAQAAVQASGAYLTSAKSGEGVADLFSAAASLCPAAAAPKATALDGLAGGEGACC
jgi:small GTP-binding protein